MPNIELEIIKRYQGCLVGAAVGDALGAPAEFLTMAQIKKHFGKVIEMVGGGYLNWKPGQTTDDTDMAMAILNSVVEKEVYDPKDIAKRFVAWMRSNPKDIGGMTQTSLNYIDSGISYQDSGKLTLERFKTAPNGSIMRTAPVGLIYRNSPEKMLQASDEISAMTHAHEQCLLACRMTSTLISDLAGGETKEKALSGLMQKFSEEPKAIQMLFDSVRGEFHRDVYNGGGYVFESFNIALNAFMNYENFEEVVVYAVNLGGDADSQATVAGAFAGAHLGIDAIPLRWKKALNPYSADSIARKAEKLYHLDLK